VRPNKNENDEFENPQPLSSVKAKNVNADTPQIKNKLDKP
jgi:hypothetical protein